jgi:hypothetical protein
MNTHDLLHEVLALADIGFYLDKHPADGPRPTLEIRLPIGTPDNHLSAAMLAIAAVVERAGRVAAPWVVDYYSIDDVVGVVFLLRSTWSPEEVEEACDLMRRFVTT